MKLKTEKFKALFATVLLHPWGIPALVAGFLLVFLGSVLLWRVLAAQQPRVPLPQAEQLARRAPLQPLASASAPAPSTGPRPRPGPDALPTERAAKAAVATPLAGSAPAPFPVAAGGAADVLQQLPAMGAPLAGRALPLGCLIEASAVAEVGTPVVGVIDKVLAERGDLVERGQVLAHHENRLERAAVTLAQQKVANNAELRAAKSQIEFAYRKAQRTAALTEQNYVSGQAREQAETEATMARMRLAQAVEQRQLALKELEMAKAQLQQRTIVSPLSGVVVDRLISAGERVENRPVFRIAQIDPLRVEVVLPTSLFGRIQVGSSARVVPDMPGATAYEAQVSIVDRVVDASSNTFRARLILPNPAQLVPAGVRCRIEFGA